MTCSFETSFLVVLLPFLISDGSAYYLRPPIVGGVDANIEDYPYQVGLEKQSSGFQICGGSILSEKYVITAAHCVRRGLQVRAGANVSSEQGQIRKVLKYTVHPDNDELSYDVAILELEAPLEFSASVNKIELPGPEELAAGTVVNVTGYGVTGTKQHQRLQVVQVPIVSREDCLKSYAPEGLPVSKDMICAGLLGTGGKDSCQGDSGGPLSYKGVLYGTVSWGRGCAEPKYPGVYGNVVKFLPFIKEVTGLGN